MFETMLQMMEQQAESALSEKQRPGALFVGDKVKGTP
jgi:hypothetical protein